MKNDTLFKSSAIGFTIGMVNGIFGAGGGMVAVIALERALKLSPERAHATALGIMLPLTVVSLAVYLTKNAILWAPIPFIAPALMLGSFLGARLLGRLNALWLNRIFSLIMLAAAIRLIV